MLILAEFLINDVFSKNNLHNENVYLQNSSYEIETSKQRTAGRNDVSEVKHANEPVEEDVTRHDQEDEHPGRTRIGFWKKGNK